MFDDKRLSSTCSKPTCATCAGVWVDVAAAVSVSGVVRAAGCGSYLRPGGSHAPDAPGGLWQRPRRLRRHGNRCGRGRCAALHEEPLSKSRLASVIISPQ